MPQLTPTFIITGTGTSVGKTWVTALLADHFLRLGHTVTITKWVQTGPENDALQIQNWVPGVSYHTHYQFPDPISPHLASERSGMLLSADQFGCSVLSQTHSQGVQLIELAGGLFTPISRSETFADILLQAQLPIILVAGNYVGTLTHTFSAMQAARSISLPLSAIVVNENQPTSAIVSSDNSKMIQSRSACPVFSIPYFQDFAAASNYSRQCGLFLDSPFIIPKAV